MSPKIGSSYAGTGNADSALGDSAVLKAPDSALVSSPVLRGTPGITAVGSCPMTPPPEDRATTAGESSSRLSAPRVRRRSALKIASTPPPPPIPSPPSAANKRRTPSSISVNARSSSVVASKGMLFSRSELRPPPLSASRKYDGNVGFGFRSMASTAAASSMSGHGRGDRGGRSSSSSLSWSDPIATGGAVGGGGGIGEGGGGGAGSPAMTDTGAVRPSESFATLRMSEARRRAAWFSDSSPSLSSPPPSLAALVSATAATTNSPAAPDAADAADAKKASVPPLPKISSIFIPTAACPLRQPGESDSSKDKVDA
ncbi:unnamed protein product, partial [Scytosiphon promiscuus]